VPLNGTVDRAPWQHVGQHLRPAAWPEKVEFVEKLPRTCSGKNMRRVPRARAQGSNARDVSTLEDKAHPPPVELAAVRGLRLSASTYLRRKAYADGHPERSDESLVSYEHRDSSLRSE